VVLSKSAAGQCQAAPLRVIFLESLCTDAKSLGSNEDEESRLTLRRRTVLGGCDQCDPYRKSGFRGFQSATPKSSEFSVGNSWKGEDAFFVGYESKEAMGMPRSSWDHCPRWSPRILQDNYQMKLSNDDYKGRCFSGSICVWWLTVTKSPVARVSRCREFRCPG